MQIIKILLLVLLCACSFLASAQSAGSIRGTITEESGLPAIALTVKLENSDLVTICDSEGKFEISNVRPGSHTLLVTGIGFAPLKQKVNVTAGKESVVAITVVPSSIEMDVVTVIGRSSVEDANRQAYNITAVDAKQLYNTTLDLAGALDRVSGVRVRESGGVGSSFNLSLNGFSGNHIRYFIDGIPMDGFGSSFQINNIPINAAERIEVYKGVVPIWLGSDALGGAINIITNERARNYIDASYSYGSFNTHRSVINAAATSRSGLTVQISAFQNYSDNDYKVKVDAADINTGAYDRGAWRRRFHDTYHNETIIASLGLVNKKFAGKLLLGMTLGKNYKEIQTGAKMTSVFGQWHRRGNIVMPHIKYKKTDLIKGLDVAVNANYNLGSELNVDTVFARYDWNGGFKRYAGRGGESTGSGLYRYKDNNGLATAMLNYRISEKQSITANNVFNTFNRKGFNEYTPNSIDPPRQMQKNVLGIGYTYSLEDSLSFSAFGKHITQKNVTSSEQGSAITSKFGYGVLATYFLKSWLQIKASYEQTNRMPEAIEMFGDVENVSGNPNLKPEKSDNVNVGVNINFAVHHHNFLINANGIYRYAQDFIFREFDINRFKLRSNNREGVRTIGGDAEIRYSYKNWLSAGATVTYQNLQNMQKFEPGYNGVSPVYLDQMPNIPYLFGNGDVSASLKNIGGQYNTLNITYNTLYVHEFFLNWPSRGAAGKKDNIPMQLSHDISIVYSLVNGRYNIGVEARNITNSLLYDNFSLQKPGRAFYVNLRYFISKNK